jgi:hypothetical protein
MNELPVKDNNSSPISGAFSDSSPLLGLPEALRERADQDGMLFFKGLIARETVLALRQDVLKILESRGLTDSRYAPIDGMADVEAVNRIPDEEIRWNGVGVTRFRSWRVFMHWPIRRSCCPCIASCSAARSSLTRGTSPG